MIEDVNENVGGRKVARLGFLAVLALVLTLSSCDRLDDIIRAQNPAQIAEEELNDPTLATVLVNSVLGALSAPAMYAGTVTWNSSLLTDEQVTGINDEQTARVNERRVRYDQHTANFGNISRYRFLADSVAGRLRNIVPNPAADGRLALILAHSGYGYNFLGEFMCEATINVGAELYTPVQLFEMAIPRFEEAIQIATAANDQTALNLARTGLARAALNAGQKAKAQAAARDVPLNFVVWVEYTQGIVTNPFQARVTGANHNLGVHPRFLNGEWLQQGIVATQTDPRIQHMPNHRTGHNGRSPLYTPYAPLRFSSYTGRTIAAGAPAPLLFTQSDNIQLASGLEAMHHYYAAAGPDATGPRGTTLEFVNERRAFGNQAPVNLSGEPLMSELREQRARDTYLGGFRLGDLRRYERENINDPRHVFPTNPHPVPGWSYGDATCFPLPLAEYVGNPNIRR